MSTTTTDGPELVYLAAQAHSNVRKRFHTDRECPQLQKSDTIRTVRRSQFPTFEHCGTCADGFQGGDTGGDTVCPLCGDSIAFNKLHRHLPCAGGDGQ